MRDWASRLSSILVRWIYGATVNLWPRVASASGSANYLRDGLYKEDLGNTAYFKQRTG